MFWQPPQDVSKALYKLKSFQFKFRPQWIFIFGNYHILPWIANPPSMNDYSSNSSLAIYVFNRADWKCADPNLRVFGVVFLENRQLPDTERERSQWKLKGTSSFSMYFRLLQRRTVPIKVKVTGCTVYRAEKESRFTVPAQQDIQKAKWKEIEPCARYNPTSQDF